MKANWQMKRGWNISSLSLFICYRSNLKINAKYGKIFKTNCLNPSGRSFTNIGWRMRRPRGEVVFIACVVEVLPFSTLCDLSSPYAHTVTGSLRVTVLGISRLQDLFAIHTLGYFHPHILLLYLLYCYLIYRSIRRLTLYYFRERKAF